MVEATMFDDRSRDLAGSSIDRRTIDHAGANTLATTEPGESSWTTS
jgi:hypothetical protein